MIPVQKQKLRYRELKGRAQIHTVSKQKNQDSSPGSQDQESKILCHSTKQNSYHIPITTQKKAQMEGMIPGLKGTSSSSSLQRVTLEPLLKGECKAL